MSEDDFVWAARLMAQRRTRYERYSPVFWRPAKQAADLHTAFLRNVASMPGAVSVRTGHGFLISTPQQGRSFVDDFAVEADGQWATEGRALLRAGIAQVAATHPVLRVVTARQDAPKRQLLEDLHFVVTERWWVKELDPQRPASDFGPVDLGGVTAMMVPAPPVFDPGGPVCLLGDVDADVAVSLSQQAQQRGAVLAVVQRDRSPGPAPEHEPVLEAAGFHNPNEFFEIPLSPAS